MTLSFNQLGQHGRLGNQMFQYAALKGIAKFRGFDFAIPPSSGVDEWREHQLIKHFKLDPDLKICHVDNQNLYEEKFYHFDPELLLNCPDGVDLKGFYQTDKYFSHIRDELLKDFSFKDNFEKPLEKYVSLHVRRGDYLNNPQHHPTCSVEYYLKALEITGGPVVVLSDDIDWCRENIPADVYIDGTSNINDLYIMTRATHNIMANSSFSWWGAWLNQNPDKIVVAPGTWFGPAYDFDTTDIVPKDWIMI
jgi:hypothetical protein